MREPENQSHRLASNPRFPHNSDMPKTKIALLGAGFIADIHIESYQRFVPDAKVLAVYTRSKDRAQAFARKHHIAQAFDDLQAAIEKSDCDVVDICLPNFLHASAVRLA